MSDPPWCPCRLSLPLWLAPLWRQTHNGVEQPVGTTRVPVVAPSCSSAQALHWYRELSAGRIKSITLPTPPAKANCANPVSHGADAREDRTPEGGRAVGTYGAVVGVGRVENAAAHSSLGGAAASRTRMNARGRHHASRGSHCATDATSNGPHSRNFAPCLSVSTTGPMPLAVDYTYAPPGLSPAGLASSHCTPASSQRARSWRECDGGF
ncbi:hypothetical protein B0H13DRAFT_2303726 [Mycena leptocephala]|nr:hypothetical protein B0H13DRAFT_2303726 [Mycena leptocephala]